MAVVALTVLAGVHSPAVDHGFLNRRQDELARAAPNAKGLFDKSNERSWRGSCPETESHSLALLQNSPMMDGKSGAREPQPPEAPAAPPGHLDGQPCLYRRIGWENRGNEHSML